MAVRCGQCGHELSIEAAAGEITELFPEIGSAGGGYMNWVSEFLANGLNRMGVECPDCRQAGRWLGTD